MNPLLTTKLYFPPLRASLVPRQRLIKQLQAGLQSPLTLISAPAGSGKTTLLSEWHAGSGAGTLVAWLSLDSADNDPTRFLKYLSAALDAIQPGLAEEIRPLLQSPEPPNPEAILTPIINRLGTLECEAILVLDDLHLIDNPAIHAALTFLLEHLPPHLHLVVLSRADPPLPLARLRARGQLVEIRAADLRFSVDESAQFLNQVMGLELSAKQVAALEKRTEGWIAGLQLAALSMHGREDVDGFVSAFTGSNHYIVDYLAEEVLARQPEALRQFLLTTSILDRMTGPLCDALTGEQDGGKFLKQLERTNLFIIPLDDAHYWYRYHHLFSDLLRKMLEQTHPGFPAELHRQACYWYEAQDMLPEALQHAISSGDLQLVTRIVSGNVLVLWENDEVGPILEKIDSLPPEQISSSPWLRIARAWILGSRQAQDPQQMLDDVESCLENAPDSVENQRLRGYIAAARAFLFCAQGDTANTIAQGSLANELLPEDEVAVRAMNLIIWGDVLVDHQKDAGAETILQQAMTLALQARKPHMAVIAMSALANFYHHSGRLRELQCICQEALAIAGDYASRHHRPLSATAEMYSLLARLHAERGENEEALQFARKGLSLSERWGLVNIESLCLSHLGRVLVLDNDWEQARQMFQRADIAARKVSPWYHQIAAVFAVDSMLDCEAPDSTEIVEQARRLQENGADIPPTLSARLLMKAGHPERALGVLEQALVDLDGQLSVDIIRLHGLRALAYQALGDEKQALASLQQALELAEPENRVATFVREGPAMERLLCLASSKSIDPQFVHRLLAAFEKRRKCGVHPAPSTKGLPEPLSGRELEVLKLLAEGFSDKQIAETLVIARETVHKHLKNIYRKLGVHSRTEAIARAHELDLL